MGDFALSPQERWDRYYARVVERFRKALMVAHADDWDMETVAEAAHVCACEQTDFWFGVRTTSASSSPSAASGGASDG
jgi:hypothetical protein